MCRGKGIIVLNTVATLTIYLSSSLVVTRDCTENEGLSPQQLIFAGRHYLMTLAWQFLFQITQSTASVSVQQGTGRLNKDKINARHTILH